MTAASSSIFSTVERAIFSPVKRSGSETRYVYFATVYFFDPAALRQRP
jgi:hypothetical protein